MTKIKNPASGIRRHPSPLRYPGGKGKIANYMKLLFLENDLVGTEYAEPFAGGASVALSLLYEEMASHVYINDIDRGVHAFWSSVLYETDLLCELVLSTPTTMKEWEHQRAIARADDPSELELGFATFFLNRTNRSGIIDGGVIGGKSQTGPWKIDARFNRDTLISRIQKAARFRSRISLSCDDGQDFIESLGATARPFFYIDPPYYVKGPGLYTNFYEHRDHVALGATVHDLDCPWLVSYDAVDEIVAMYNGDARIEYSLSYSAGKDRSKGSEVMFFSAGLRPPSTDSPANVSVSVVDKRRLELVTGA